MTTAPVKNNIFILEEIFPKVEDLLLTIYPEQSEIIKNCIFVLDANILLAPFFVGQESFQKVQEVFTSLVAEEKLFLPERAVREYARNRAEQARRAYEQIEKKLSAIPNLEMLKIPMYEDNPQYKEVIDAGSAVNSEIKKYRSRLNELKQTVLEWNYNDSVSKFYSNIFSSQQIIGTNKSKEDLIEDLDKRLLNNIPPGYKDKGKDDQGIGDIIIWHSILELGKSKESHVVFVSNDQKADWMVRAEKEGLFPRFELVEEFYRETGKHFAIINFSRFLQIKGAEQEVVDEVDKASTVVIPLVESPASEHASLSLVRIINELAELVREFIEDSGHDGNGYRYIWPAQEFEGLVHNYIRQFHNVESNLQLDKREQFSTVQVTLSRMLHLNQMIEFESVRMKRNCTAEEEELIQCAWKFIDFTYLGQGIR